MKTKEPTANTLRMEEGSNHWNTPQGRKCFGSWNEEDDSLEIELAPDDTKVCPEMDVGLGPERDESVSGTDFSQFFVLDETVVVSDSSGSHVRELSIFCHDEESVRSFLKQPGVLQSIKQLFSDHGVYAVSTTEAGGIYLLWMNWKPPRPDAGQFLMGVLLALDSIANSGFHRPPEQSSRMRKQKLKVNRYTVLSPKTSGGRYWWLTMGSLGSGCLSVLSSQTINLSDWLFQYLYLPSFLLFFIYFWLFHIRNYRIWKELRQEKGKAKSRGLKGHLIAIVVLLFWSNMVSLFFALPMLSFFSYPVSAVNSTFGQQIEVSNSAIIVDKTDSTGEAGREYSFHVKNNIGTAWAIEVSAKEYAAYEKGASYSTYLYCGSLGILYFRKSNRL